MEVDSLSKAVSALLSIYFVYDIAYPKQCANSLLFVERHLFGLKGGPKFSPSVLAIVMDIEQL